MSRQGIITELEARKKQVGSTAYKHGVRQCHCSKVRTWECRDTQRRLRKLERAYLEVIRDQQMLLNKVFADLSGGELNF